MSRESSIYKIVIDTNVWISFLIGKRMHRLLQCILDERVIVITCKAQMLELLRVVEKPKIKKLVSPHQIAAFLHFLEAHT
ncbi:MAG: putative toxin-antitoxin system toxin component, PIN family, partial [Prevotellaceae bacterium]|nr:putative toxin-antitoxin system toxin component, PIN family [Prevotellaceae bacterium]